MRILYLTDTDTMERVAEVTDEWVQEHPELWDMGFVIEVWDSSKTASDYEISGEGQAQLN